MSFSQKALQNDIQESFDQRMGWIQEEMNIQLSTILDTYSKNINSRIETLSHRLAPYFKEHMHSKDRDIRKFALQGLEEIKTKFPDLA